MKASACIGLLILSIAPPARAEDEFPQFSTAGASAHLHRLTVRSDQASTGERGGGSDAGAVAAMSDEAFGVPGTGIAVLALSASWCAPCRRHIAALTRLQRVLSTQCGRAGDSASPRVIEITDHSLLKAFRQPNSRNRASRDAWGSADLGHDLVMVPEAHDDAFMELSSMSAPGAGGPIGGSYPGTLIVVDGRIVSISAGDTGIFAGEMDECAGISDTDRQKVQDYNAKTSACFVLRSTRKTDGTNRVGANALSCTFECPVSRPEITCNGR